MREMLHIALLCVPASSSIDRTAAWPLQCRSNLVTTWHCEEGQTTKLVSCRHHAPGLSEFKLLPKIHEWPTLSTTLQYVMTREMLRCHSCLGS